MNYQSSIINHQPSVWVHTLVKNEEKWLWYSVTSVIDYVDRLLLWDTGSTDGSIEIEEKLVKKYPEKIFFKTRPQKTAEDFAQVRQEMFEETKSDWFIMLDADEIWWEDSIQKLILEIKNAEKSTESIVVPTINLVGDIFHYQEKEAGRYRFGNKVGHYNLRAVKRSIPGLHSQGSHGVWGWADEKGKMIQDRGSDKVHFLEAPYLHTTFLSRGGKRLNDLEVAKRAKKLKYEIGKEFPLDFYYPEVFFRTKPEIVKSPWETMDFKFKFISYLETPLRKIKRRIWWGRAGY